MNHQAKADEKPIKELFVGKCWSYLNDNFHKFSEPNKIKIALELCKKDMPEQFIGDVKVTEMASIQKEYPGEPDGLTLNRIAEFDIGSPDSSKIT